MLGPPCRTQAFFSCGTWGPLLSCRVRSSHAVCGLQELWRMGLAGTWNLPGPGREPVSSALSWSLLRVTSIESVMLSNHLIFCPPVLLLRPVFPSIRIFSSYELALCIRWPKYQSYSFSISPFNEYLELIFFRIYF